MNRLYRIVVALFLLASAGLWPSPAMGQDQAGAISGDEIVALNTKLTKAGEPTSSARKKLAIRRVIREAESLIKKYPSAPNRYEVLSIQFRSQQMLLILDKSVTNRKAFLATCEKLAVAPNAYAALRSRQISCLRKPRPPVKGVTRTPVPMRFVPWSIATRIPRLRRK